MNFLPNPLVNPGAMIAIEGFSDCNFSPSVADKFGDSIITRDKFGFETIDCNALDVIATVRLSLVANILNEAIDQIEIASNASGYLSPSLSNLFKRLRIDFIIYPKADPYYNSNP